MGNSTRNQKRGKLGWKIALIVLAIVTLLASGLLITLDVRKVEVEKKIDQEAAKEKPMSRTAPTFPPVQPRDNN